MANEMRPALLTVVRGEPDETELAAVTAVLLALLGERDRTAEAAGGTEPECAGDPADPAGSAPRAVWRPGRPGYRSPAAWSRP